jgi:hypothetical protein
VLKDELQARCFTVQLQHTQPQAPGLLRLHTQLLTYPSSMPSFPSSPLPPWLRKIVVLVLYIGS